MPLTSFEPRGDSPDTCPRAIGGRKVVEIRRVPWHRGTIRRAVLECGHVKDEIGSNNLEVGHYTRCERCRR